jgi:hypothetical protein
VECAAGDRPERTIRMAQTQHRRTAGGGRPGGFTWTSLNGQTRLFVPWRDLLENGRPTDAQFMAVRDALYEYDRRLEDPEDTTVPPLPTPHAEVVTIDQRSEAEFEAELAVRLVAHKGRMADAHG